MALLSIGSHGRPAGTTAFDAALRAPSPTSLRATTVNVYVVPFVNPSTVAAVCPPPTATDRPPLAVTV